MNEYEERKKELFKLADEIQGKQLAAKKPLDARDNKGRFSAYLNLALICCLLSALFITASGAVFFTKDRGKYFITTQDGKIEQIIPYKIL